MVHASRDPALIWSIRLLDGPAIEDALGNCVRRFRSQRVGALLAYLALNLGRPIPREELIEALWPNDNTDAVANRFRFTLSSLRRQLEPRGESFGSVLDVSEPGRVRLRSGVVWCDVAEFESAVRAGRTEEAAVLAQGTLLPGYYDEWVVTERERLDSLCEWLRMQPVAHVVRANEAPQRANDVTSRRIPLYLTRFFGRETERRLLVAAAGSNRLVTVTGPGGVGKTRLVVETAPELAESCVFVLLADVTDADRVPEAVLRTLMVSVPSGADAIAHLISVLQQRNALTLILDNAEHLVEAIAVFSLRVLEAVPQLRILITSRQRLDLPGEAVFQLEPLEPPGHAAVLDTLLEFPAAALFVDRACIARPDFKVTPKQISSLIEICRRLEGLPLALELAAARVTSQAPARIAESLANNLTDLTSHQRGISPRHRSLRAAIQGSYSLLQPDAQQFFARLSVFRGGWTAEAARAVTAGEETERLLNELVARSLVVVREDASTGVMRYAFLESLRQFAGEVLVMPIGPTHAATRGATAPNDDAAEVARRHALYYLGIAERSVPELEAQGTSAILVELEHEHDNLRAALQWSLDAREYGLAHRLTEALSDFWATRGHLADGRRWHELLLGSWAEAPPSVLADIRLGCGLFATRQNDTVAAKAHLRHGLTLNQNLRNERGVMRCTLALANAYRLGGEHTSAMALYNACLELCSDSDDENERAKCHHGLGISSHYRGEYQAARRHLEIALEIRKKLGHRLDVARTQNLLAFAMVELADLDAGESMFLECARVFAEYGERWYIASTEFGLAIIAYARGKPAAARERLEASLEIMRGIGSMESVASCLTLISCVYLKLAMPLEARNCAREALDVAMSIHNAQSMAMALWSAAAVLEALTEYVVAATILSASAALCKELSILLVRIGRTEIDCMSAHLEAVLGTSAFELATATGGALDVRAAYRLALSALPM